MCALQVRGKYDTVSGIVTLFEECEKPRRALSDLCAVVLAMSLSKAPIQPFCVCSHAADQWGAFVFICFPTERPCLSVFLHTGMVIVLD